MALVMGTMSLIVAMLMEGTLVTEFLSPSFAFWSNVIDFDLVRFAEHQTTPSTLALLLVEQHGECPSRRRVVFESLAPVEEIAIIGTCGTLDFHMSPDFRPSMPSQYRLFGSRKDTVLAFALFPVSLSNPVLVFVVVPVRCP